MIKEKHVYFGVMAINELYDLPHDLEASEQAPIETTLKQHPKAS